MTRLSTKFFLTRDIGRFKSGVYDITELGAIHLQKPEDVIPIAWALRDGLVEADVSEAEHVDDLTFYKPGELANLEKKVEKNKNKFLVNKLGEIIHNRQ